MKRCGWRHIRGPCIDMVEEGRDHRSGCKRDEYRGPGCR